jgi:hypothetical protein
MTLKEKAQELVSKFEYQEGYGISESTGIYGINFHQAKQCALVAVDEMIEIAVQYEDALSASQTSDYPEFLKELKQEIEKL